MASGLHVSISAEPIAEVAGLQISNSILTSLVVSFLLIVFALLFRARLKKTDRPSGLQNVVEMIIEALYGFVHSITENEKKTQQFFPVIATFFLFIIFNNYLGLLPGVGSVLVPKHEVEAVETQVIEGHTEQDLVFNEGETEEVLVKEEHQETVPLLRAGTADLNTTIALAIISVFCTQYFGIASLGISYFKKFFNFSSVINAFVGLLELISEFAKIISFAFRLFGNIFAGEVLLVVITYLTSLLVPMPFYALELFVGFIQALVFSMLSLLFFNLASKHHTE